MRFAFVPLSMFCAVLAMAPAAAATLTGKTISARYEFPNVGDVYPLATASPPTFVVGAGPESTIDVEGVTFISVDFEANALLLDLSTVLQSPTWVNSAQNGPVFEILSGGNFRPVANVVASNGFAVDAIVTGATLRIDWGGMSYATGDTVRVSFVPLPVSAALLLSGVGALASGSALRKRRLRQTGV